MTEPPTGWASATLGELGDWFGGGTPSKGVDAFWRGDIPWVSPKDMKVERIRDTADHITAEAVYASSTNLVPAGSVLVVTRSGILRHSLPVAVTEREVGLNQDLKAVVTHEGVLADWLAWLLRWRAKEILVTCSKAGTTVNNLDTSKLLATTVPVAPAVEQQRIVAAIEEQFSRLDAADSVLSPLSDRLRRLESLLIGDAIGEGWPERPWGEVGASQNGRAFPSKDYTTQGVRLLRPGNLHQSGRVVWTADNSRFLPERYAARNARFLVGPGELVINLTAQSLKDEFLGRVCLTGPGECCLLNQRIARLTPASADARFLLWVFKGARFRRFVASLNTGSMIQHMFTSQLAAFPVPLPPLDQQRRIVAEIESRLSAIETTRDAINDARRRGDALRRSILERAFRGELVPQDPSDEPASVLLDRIRAQRAAASSPRRGSSRRPARSGHTG